VGAAAIVADAGAAAAIGAAPIATAAAAAANIGVMVFNPIRMVELPSLVYVLALPESRAIGPATLPLTPV
jgi:translation initiation factor 2B subunit (eIF-2B alpha/beta/delta family)